MQKQEWLEPTGEIFVIEESKYLHEWLGCDGSRFPEFATDYDKSCEVYDYFGVINIYDRPIMVLGDEPMPLCIVFYDNKHYLIRWIYAPADFTIEEHIENISKHAHTSLEEKSVPISLKTNELVVHNAAISGIEDKNLYHFKVLSTNFYVTTYSYQPTTDIHMIFHEFNYNNNLEVLDLQEQSRGRRFLEA